MMNRNRLLGMIAIVAVIWLFAACDDGSIARPTVTGVTVSPSTASVERGQTQQFTAIVEGTNNHDQTVSWHVTGGGTGTNISESGVLTVAVGETALSLTVTATSTFDTGISGIATVSVTAIAPDITTPVGITATFGQTLAQVTLPSGWVWVSPSAQVGNAGERTHPATYTRAGNYLPVTRNITVTVERAIPSYTIPANINAVFGQTLSDVSLPLGWTWDDPAAPVGAIGIQTHDATYTPSDTNNFVALTRQINVNVSAAPAVEPGNYSIPTGLTAVFGQTLAQVTLPANWTWVTPSAAVGNAGLQTHSATYTRPGNYLPVTRNVTVTVTQATVTDYVIPTGLTAEFGQTLSDVSLPANWVWVTPNASVGALG